MGWQSPQLKLVTPTVSAVGDDEQQIFVAISGQLMENKVVALKLFLEIFECEYFTTLEYLFPFLRLLVCEVWCFDLSSDCQDECV